MFGRRSVAECRRIVQVLLVAFVLVSLTGPFRNGKNPSEGSDSNSVSVGNLNYSICGFFPRIIPQGIISRLTERIKCRSSAISPAVAVFNVSDAKNDSQPMFLTHDLFNAVGLGNFMFMAATLLGLAQSSGRKPFFLDYHHHMAVFGPTFPMANRLPANEFSSIPDGVLMQNVLEVKTAGKYDPGLTSTVDVHRRKVDDDDYIPAIFALRGYFQSWKYFHTSTSLIRRQFTFSNGVFKRALEALKSTINDYVKTTSITPTTIIGVHVRRGDILKPIMKKYGHTAATKSYISNLVSNFTVRYSPALFIVLTNDVEYCQTLFSHVRHVRLITGNAAEVDMAILSLMDHLILTVGSFGWWGAYLSDADEVFYYRNWPTHGSEMDKEYRRSDYFLPRWLSAE